MIRAVVAALALSVVGLPLAATHPVRASADPGSARRAAACRTAVAARGTGARAVPKWRRLDDTAVVTKADLRTVPSGRARGAYVEPGEPTLPARVNIPVFVHVIRGSRKSERHPAGPQKVRAMISTLNHGMAGSQSPASAKLRYRFLLRKIDYTKNNRWYHAYLYNKWDIQAKRTLHRGGRRTLNIYLNGGGPLLGWARFPWQVASTPRLDGVSVSVAALRGGRAKGYNLGDTVVHETGHWLGLYHTFQGGCGVQNDLVADTPAEAEPSFGCDTTRDTCAADPDVDPVHNFMDYSLDLCMNQFTPGQVQRIDAAFARWRR